MVDFGFFGLEPFSWTTNKICSELDKLGYSTKLYNWNDIELIDNNFYYKSDLMDIPKVAMTENKIRVGYRGDLIYLFDWLRLLEHKGVCFLNTPFSIQMASNKVFAAAILTKNEVNTPETVAVNTLKDIETCLYKWKDMILKPIVGQASIRVNRFIYDGNRFGDELTNVLNNLQRAEAVQMLYDFKMVCAQKYVKNKGRDIRVHVVNNKVVSLYARNALPNTWKIMDLNLGMSLSKVNLTPEIEEQSLKAIKALELDYGTIDLVEGEEGITVIEVNPSVTIWEDHEKCGFTLDKDGSLKYYVNAIVNKLVS